MSSSKSRFIAPTKGFRCSVTFVLERAPLRTYSTNMLERLFGKQKQPLEPRSPSDPAEHLASSPEVDWRHSEIHLMLLARFLDRASADSAPEYWESALGEAPGLAVKRFLQSGLLVPTSLATTVAYCNTVAILKKLLKERQLKVSGKKQELAERLVDADSESMSRLHVHRQVVACSPEARNHVIRYLESKRQEYDRAIQDSLAALRVREFEKASHTIRAFQSKQLRLSPPNPIAIEGPPMTTATDVAMLDTIFTARPKILRELPANDWEPFRIVAALSGLLGGQVSLEWFPLEFVGIRRLRQFTALRMM